MRPPPRVPATRVVKIVDLPFEAFNQILSNIKNIREKVRLMRLCKRFYDVVLEHLSRLRYRIVNRDDYLYQGEIARGSWLNEEILNLSSLLEIAPHLTHLVDDMKRIYVDHSLSLTSAILTPLSLKYLRDLTLSCLKDHFFSLNQEQQFLRRIELFLSDAPLIQTLHITVDRPTEFVIPRLETLRTFRFDYFLNAKYTRVNNQPISKFPISFYGILDGSAPNLDELKIHLRYMDAYVQLNDILWRITCNCPKLIYLSITFRNSMWPIEGHRFAIHGYGDWHLPNIRILEIKGIIIPFRYWEMILAASPKLHLCFFDKYSDVELYTMLSHEQILANNTTVDIPQYLTYIRNLDE